MDTRLIQGINPVPTIDPAHVDRSELVKGARIMVFENNERVEKNQARPISDQVRPFSFPVVNGEEFKSTINTGQVKAMSHWSLSVQD